MRGKHKIVTIGKYTSLVVILVYIIGLFVWVSGSNRPFDEVSTPLIRTLEATDMVEVNGQGFRRFYGINPADLEGVVMFTSEFRLSAEEVLLIQVQCQEQITEIVHVIEENLAMRRKNFETVAPEEVHWIDNAQLTVRGEHIFLAVGSQATEFRRVFLNAL
jgi:hypothetical protein